MGGGLPNPKPTGFPKLPLFAPPKPAKGGAALLPAVDDPKVLLVAPNRLEEPLPKRLLVFVSGLGSFVFC